jgi:DNA-binding NarL/FixJ family response regulator
MDGNAKGTPQSWARESRGTDRVKSFPPLLSAAGGRAHAGRGKLSLSRLPDSERLPIEELTARENDVLQCLSRGLPTSAIAQKLLINPATVRNHVQNILQKLDVHTRLGAVVFAVRHDLL